MLTTFHDNGDNDNDDVYIGETGPLLSHRFQEHYRSAANPTAKSCKNMAFSKHYKTCHEGQKPKLKAKIQRKTKWFVGTESYRRCPNSKTQTGLEWIS